MRYLIYSFRNRAWHRAELQGYTLDNAQAGRYDEDAAGKVVIHGLPGSNVAVDTVLVENWVASPLEPDALEKQIEEWRSL